MPMIGDLCGDGKINALFYDIHGDDDEFSAGLFTTADFFENINDGLNLWPEGQSGYGSYANTLAMFHIDVGGGPERYQTIGGPENEGWLQLLGTMAHEFQHLLFYMYFDIYTRAGGVSREYLWATEMLSELAYVYFTIEGVQNLGFGNFVDALQNSYFNGLYSYGDFLHFNNSKKNYRIGMFFAIMMYKAYGSDFTRGIYENIVDIYNGSFSDNIDKILSDGHDKTISRILHNITGVGNDENALLLFYTLFMEHFAADGGMIHGQTPTQTTKFGRNTNPFHNFWAYRSVMNNEYAVVFLDHDFHFGVLIGTMELQDVRPKPELSSGDTVILEGFGQPKTGGATHEKFLLLEGGGSETPYITITVPEDGNINTRYYIVLPNDEIVRRMSIPLGEEIAYSSGAKGADLYPLTKGTAVSIDTQGQPAFLFVSTFRQDVDATIYYAWSVEKPEDPEDSEDLNDFEDLNDSEDPEDSEGPIDLEVPEDTDEPKIPDDSKDPDDLTNKTVNVSTRASSGTTQTATSTDTKTLAIVDEKAADDETDNAFSSIVTDDIITEMSEENRTSIPSDSSPPDIITTPSDPEQAISTPTEVQGNSMISILLWIGGALGLASITAIAVKLRGKLR
jgi:hypothetical protein